MATVRQITPYPLRPRDRVLKRWIDIFGSLFGLVFFGWLIVFSYLVATIDTRQSGFFRQDRVGKDGRLFKTIKIRTMRDIPDYQTTVTTDRDPRITKWGRFFRKTKIDELPQLINVLRGEMSFVGPRPDVPGFADRLTGPDRIVLTVRPGITGPATLHFRNEEEILAAQSDPEQYNRDVVFPEKVRLNRAYIENYRIADDFRYIFQTLMA